MESLKPSLSSLPVKIIKKIIECNVISYVELCRLSCASRNFYSLINNKIWKLKYEQMWPDLAALFHVDNTDWKLEFRLRLDFKVMIHAWLKKVSVFYHNSERNIDMSDHHSIEQISQYHPSGWVIIDDELLSIIKAPDKFHKLTLQYCAKRFYWEMNHSKFKENWISYFSVMPPTIVALLHGIIVLGDWLRPTRINCFKEVPQRINYLAEKVFQEVAKRSPSHCLIKRGLLDPDYTEEYSCWSPHECQTILSCINTVMFEELEFSGRRSISCTEDILIDEVLKKRTGLSEMIAIVYRMVAGKLGVVCLPEGFPGNFYLKWLAPPPYLGERETCIFIDVNNKGAFKSWEDICNSARFFEGNAGVWYASYAPMKILAEICLQFIQAIPEFWDEESILLTRSALHLTGVFMPNYEQSQIEQATIGVFLEGTIKFHFRGVADKEVKYAVGMIMRRKRYNERCVIFAWERIRSTNTEQDVNQQNDVQVYVIYCVLVEGGLKHIVREEELEIDHTKEPICNGEVGKYFESFNGCFYIPNHFMDRLYPEDARVRERSFRRSIPEA